MGFIKKIIMAVSLLFTASTIVNAALVNNHDNTIADSSLNQSIETISAKLILSDNEALLLKNWATPSQKVYLPSSNKIEINKPLSIFVLFGKCAVNSEGNCDLKMKITVYKPDGTVYSSDQPLMEVWSGKPPPRNKRLGLSVDYTRIIIEPGEPFGKYKVDAKIIDQVNGASMVLNSQFTATEVAQQGYSTNPLDNPVFNYAHVVADTPASNNWLNNNYSKLNPQEIRKTREHLYYLLNTYVSELYKRDKVILPKEPDLILQTLFYWSEKLGVFGGSLVYNKVKSEQMEPLSEFKTPQSFILSLEKDLYQLTTESNAWTIKYPYYFMTTRLQNYKASNDMQMQVVVISTGAARDNSPVGRSQGTLLLAYSPSTQLEAFSNHWLNKFDIKLDTKPTPLGIRDLSSQHVYDKKTLLHHEVTSWASETGSYVVMFMGVDGTYQTNRPHYLDFISQLKQTIKN